MTAWYEESVALAGLQNRFASVRTPTTSFKSVDTVQEELFEPLKDLVALTVKEDGADVVILGGAPLAGLAHRIEGAAAVLVDPISAAICQAQAMVTLSPKGSHAGSYARPPAKQNIGLNSALGDWIARRT
jgi:allantoin racemase